MARPPQPPLTSYPLSAHDFDFPFHPMKLVLTGPLQSGKSTRLRALMASAGWDAPAGFRTWWDDDRRRGGKLMLAPWDASWTFVAGDRAHLDAPGLASAALRALANVPPTAPLVIDELGLLEASSAPLHHRVLDLWSAAAEGILIVQSRALSSWPELGPVSPWP